jgi:hypothetical protein
MEFTPRGTRGPAPQPAQAPHPAHAQAVHGRRKHVDWAARTIRFELFTVIVGSALLLAAVSLYIAFSGGVNTEAKSVDGSKYQAVFLNGGVTSGSVSYSTYFGHITKLNDNYVVLKNVYYLTDQSTSTNGQSASSPQLTKLGCQQLHSPYDEMVINRSQLAFWENIKDDGKVVQAIKQFQQQNPNGPNCNSQSSGGTSSDQSTTSTQTPATTTTPAPTPTPAPTKKP